MPYYAVVIADADLAHAKEVERHVEHHVRILGEGARHRIEMHVRQSLGAKRQVGDLHAHLHSDCPDGLPNCRQCGDPAHVDACRAAGHCPHCGTRHGIAPDATVTANGYVLQEIDPPVPGHVWDTATRRFVNR